MFSSSAIHYLLLDGKRVGNYFVRFDVSSESDVQLRDCLKHVPAMTTDDC